MSSSTHPRPACPPGEEPRGRSDPPLSRDAVTARLRAAGCVFAEEEAGLLIEAAATPDDLHAMVDRRVRGLPLEHILGWVEFCGLRIAVDPGVFVPRRRTEFLARQALDRVRHAAAAPGPPAVPGLPAVLGPAALPGPPAVPGLPVGSGPPAVPDQPSAPSPPVGPGPPAIPAVPGPPGVSAVPGVPSAPGLVPPVVVELCCGSGAIGAVLCAALPGIELHATDIDPAAVACARRNLAAAGAAVYRGDLYQPLPTGLRSRVRVLVANAPYVPTGDFGLLPAEARVHEPRTALDGGRDGLDVLRGVIAGAPGWLAPGGCVLVEASEGQAPRLMDLATRAGLRPEVATSTEEYATVVTAHWR